MEGTECIMGFCDHPKARNWVQCDRCSRWYHCTCVDVSAAVARGENFRSLCSSLFEGFPSHLFTVVLYLVCYFHLVYSLLT